MTNKKQKVRENTEIQRAHSKYKNKNPAFGKVLTPTT